MLNVAGGIYFVVMFQTLGSVHYKRVIPREFSKSIISIPSVFLDIFDILRTTRKRYITYMINRLFAHPQPAQR